MAVTAVQHVGKEFSGELGSKYADESITETWRISLNAKSRNLPTILNQARALNAEFPGRGQAWPVSPGYGLFAKKFHFTPDESDLQLRYKCKVSYLPLEPNEPNKENVADNPLLWPAVYGVEWLENEEAITEGRNVQQFTGGFSRAALTLGPIVNTAYQEFDEGLFRTVRRAVLTITENVSSLDEILAIEEQYADTCNSDTVFGIGPRKFEFLGVENGGEQTANGIKYFQRTIRVLKRKTTDRKLNNVGWKHFKSDNQTIVAAKIEDPDDSSKKVLVAEPVFLGLNGQRSAAPVTIDYRVLAEVPYQGLLA